MTLTTLEQEILTQLHHLALAQQREVLAFVRTLTAMPVGIPGKELLVFAGAIEHHDLAMLQQAIDTDCAKVNLDEW
ncbi:MAG: hypothetical protein EI684_21930 [Candidatus Viridilinea halotolerans]|uniref:DUF2281 domain-containing protein n=1 Tax=Candidatus Viridilinea halotolerans TaxID=2491704 RepID=A0A426TR46_9CHLR|nr:MAG: hypothetical protein EI684_21930 [Candidatus Viridilinea halotolerans]